MTEAIYEVPAVHPFVEAIIMATKKSAAPKKAAPTTSPKIKSIAGQGLKSPSTLTTAQVRELAGSVME